MENKKCPHCKTDIAIDAKKCPHCHSDLRNWFIRNKLLSGCLGCFGILIFLGVIGSIINPNLSKSKINDQINMEENNSQIQEKVSMEKFNKLKDGMSYQEVVKILGSEGEVISSSEIAGIKTVMYKWDGEGFGANMNAMFQNGKMISKAQFGLK